MKRILVMAIFSCLSALPPPVPVAAQDIGNHKSMRDEGFLLLYDSQYAKADRKFAEYIRLEPNDPAGFLADFNARFLLLRDEQKSVEAPTTEDNKREYERFDYLVSAGIEKTEEKIAEGRDVEYYKFVQAYLYLAKSTIAWGNHHQASALKDVKVALSIAQKSHYKDADYLVGLVNYLSGSRGWTVRHFLLVPAGIPHDRSEGMRLICGVAEGGANPFSDDVRTMLFKIVTDTRVSAADRAADEASCRRVYGNFSTESLFRELKGKYPENELVLEYQKKHGP